MQNFIKRQALPFFAAVFILLFTAVNAHLNPKVSNAENRLAVHFIDVGQGDSTFIVLPSGRNILVDAGSVSEGPKTVQYLKSLGVSKIDHLILTHPHDDHIGGISSVVSGFEVLNFHDNGLSNFKSDVYSDYIKTVRKDLSRYSILQAGESLLFKDTAIEVLNPLLPPSGNHNHDSIVLRLIYGGIKILLAGDIGQPGEKRLLNLGGDLTAQILKTGHHGDKDACSDDFLKKVMPETAIISVGRFNRYARPHKEALERLKNAGAKIYRTDLNGNIMLKTDGKTYTIRTEK